MASKEPSCSKCGAPSGSGFFCSNCGNDLRIKTTPSKTPPTTDARRASNADQSILRERTTSNADLKARFENLAANKDQKGGTLRERGSSNADTAKSTNPPPFGAQRGRTVSAVDMKIPTSSGASVSVAPKSSVVTPSLASVDPKVALPASPSPKVAVAPVKLTSPPSSIQTHVSTPVVPATLPKEEGVATPPNVENSNLSATDDELNLRWQAAESKIAQLELLLREAEANIQMTQHKVVKAEALAIEKEALVPTIFQEESAGGPPPPPPPPGPPPPPSAGPPLPSVPSDRANLLASIRSGKKLKKTKGPPSQEEKAKDMEKKEKANKKADPNNLSLMAAVKAKQRSTSIADIEKQVANRPVKQQLESKQSIDPSLQAAKGSLQKAKVEEDPTPAQKGSLTDLDRKLQSQRQKAESGFH